MVIRTAVLGMSIMLLAGWAASSRPVSIAQAAKHSSGPRVEMVKIHGVYAFRPKTITIRRGTTVTWINQSDADHTVTADTGAWSSVTISHGKTYRRTFKKAGRYGYVCGLHGYMTGMVIVK